VYNGSRNGVSTVKNLLARLIDSAVEPGTIVWDRGNVSKSHLNEVEKSGWKLICGIPKTPSEVKDILDDTSVSADPMTFVRKSKSGCIYAERTKGKLYGRERSVVVYTNQRRKMAEADARNEMLSVIGKKLDSLSKERKGWSEKRVHHEIESTVGDFRDFVWTRVSRSGDGPMIKWGFKKRELEKAAHLDGKYLLYSTDESPPADEVVDAYLEKDYIEKVFMTLKTKEKIEPVCHRLENRVKGIIFVCVLAYRLLSVLQWKLKETQEEGEGVSWESAEVLLRLLSRVERMEVSYGKQKQIWYLNVVDKIKRSVRILGYPNLFRDCEIESFEV
jgi:hypothetical protein